jgi:hypothetical protein
MEHSEIILGRAPHQHYILDEAVIQRRVGVIMPRQLQHLANLAAARAEITIQIIPFSAGPHFGMRGPFTLLTFDANLDDVLYLENARGGDLVVAGNGGGTVAGNDGDATAGEDAVATYREEFDRLLTLALDPQASIEMIMRVAREMAPA